MNATISESDYVHISGLAYRELIGQKCGQFLIHPNAFVFPDDDIIITSFQDYARKTKTDINLLIPGSCRDGFVYRNARPGLDLILYNANMLNARARFTIAHEIGHSRLKHRLHTRREEAEAHLFASQLLAPDVMLWKIRYVMDMMSPELIASTCGISMAAAEQKFYDYRICHRLKTEYDEMLLQKFKFYIRCFYRPHMKDALDIVVD